MFWLVRAEGAPTCVAHDKSKDPVQPGLLPAGELFWYDQLQIIQVRMLLHAFMACLVLLSQEKIPLSE